MHHMCWDLLRMYVYTDEDEPVCSEEAVVRICIAPVEGNVRSKRGICVRIVVTDVALNGPFRIQNLQGYLWQEHKFVSN